MASPIPTQLSPGVNVSEIDLSQFVQPESLNSGGMVGVFNWGPGYEKNKISTESQLVDVYGKPTLDQSDNLGNKDFLAASNFLKYSPNLNVIRVLKAQDSNSTSVEAGITRIESCTYRTISNLEEFKRLGGFSSGGQGIEPVAHFRARYPGNFGDSLKVYVSDGNTSSVVTTTGMQYSGFFEDFVLKGGYQNTMIQGITSGICGLTLVAVVDLLGIPNVPRILALSTAAPGQGGPIGVTMPYYIVTFQPPNNLTPEQFIGKAYEYPPTTVNRPNLVEYQPHERFNFLYATGTTTENYNLTGGGSKPDGNVKNVSPAGYSQGQNNGAFAQAISLFGAGYFDGGIFDPAHIMRVNPGNTAFVDMIFLDADKYSMGIGDNYNATPTWQDTTSTWRRDGNDRLILYTDVIAASGLPSHFMGSTAGPTDDIEEDIKRRVFFSAYATHDNPTRFHLAPASFFVYNFPEEPDTPGGASRAFVNRYTPIQFVLDYGHLFYYYLTGNENFPPPTNVKGIATFIGLTGTHTFVNHTDNVGIVGGTTFTVDFGSVGGINGIRDNFKYGIVQIGRKANVSGTVGVGTTETSTSSSQLVFEKQPDTSAYAQEFGGSNDEINFAVVDTLGKFGPKNAILERFELLSKAVDAKNANGESIYYKDYINNNSNYVYMTKAFSLTGGNASIDSKADANFGEIQYFYQSADAITYASSNYAMQLDYGVSGVSAATKTELLTAYSMFADDDNAVDVLFVPELYLNIAENVSDTNLELDIYSSVIEARKDTIFIVPTPNPSINQSSSIQANNAITFRKTTLAVPSNSYTMLVAGRKVFFDTFNNQLRKMPLSSDLAGILCAQQIPWESPAGFARGTIRNAIKLETNFSKADRDELYKNGINFFVQFNDGSGTVLFSDKTLLTKPSAFDRINVRRVFIALEKAISKAAKYSLFEFNDEFTRSQFRNLVIPFLSNIQSQRGIADFKVVCDETNNTQEVIDKNQFVADIYIKPLKSINFIQLNFIAVRSDFNLSTLE